MGLNGIMARQSTNPVDKQCMQKHTHAYCSVGEQHQLEKKKEKEEDSGHIVCFQKEIELPACSQVTDYGGVKSKAWKL